MTAPDLCAEAVARDNSGWSIIPVRNNPATGRKLAACKWTTYQTRRPTNAELRRLFSKGGLTGLAGIAGEVSGGLFFRDWDVPAAYQEWATAYPDLARGVRALEVAEGRQWSDDEMLKRVFLPWYEQNRFLREGQTLADYWQEFLSAYDDVRYPLGEGILEQAFRRAASSDPPAEAARFRDPRTRMLASWCRELQRAAGNEPFFLSTRTVSSGLKLGSPSRATAYLHRLTREKILAEVEKGGPTTNRALALR
jgi:hypothetical protein